MDNLINLKKNGKFFVLAFDHRGSFVKMMQKNASKTIENNDAIELKKNIIKPLLPEISGILIDEDYGVPAYKMLEANAPFLLPAEKTGYTDEAGERITEIFRTGEELKNMGANAVKLLLYVNNHVPTWKKQIETAKKVISDAHEVGLPVFLEFVLYNNAEIHSDGVSEVVKQATDEGVIPDVWKIPYPGSYEESKKVSETVKEVPWVLLTGGSTFDEFVEQYKIAISAGASGFVAGRALWQEACSLFEDKTNLEHFVNETLVNRFKKLVEIS